MIGATCTLTGNGQTGSRKPPTVSATSGSRAWTSARYSLEITAQGFASKSFAPISTEVDVNLGDIALV